jgi:hypothetical protein
MEHYLAKMFHEVMCLKVQLSEHLVIMPDPKYFNVTTFHVSTDEDNSTSCLQVGRQYLDLECGLSYASCQ